MGWVADTPIAMIRASQAMLPRLRARESLLAATRVGVGSHRLDLSAAKGILKDWQRLADPQVEGAGQIPVPSPAGLALFGIGARKVTVIGPRPKVGKGRKRG